jgi:hypothetical protein
MNATVERSAGAVEAVALALWVGALAGFAFLFAPAAFHTVSNLDEFAALTAGVLRSLGTFGFVCGTIAIVAALGRGPGAIRLRLGRFALILVMWAFAWYESNRIIPHMEATARSFGVSIASIPKGDPRRIAYDAEHRTSSRVYSVVLLAGILAIVLASLERRPEG